MKTRQQHLLALETDIDCRLAELWQQAFEIEGWTLEKVGVFLRAAYGAGYTQALQEPARGQLCTENGYSTPKRGRA